MIRLCTGFPTDWPQESRERFTAGIEQLWPPSIELVADPPTQGGDLDRHRLIVPAAAAADMADGDIVAWLDPDLETYSSVPSYVIPQLLKDADICFIGTDAGEADLAFWAARLSPAVRLFLNRLAQNSVDGIVGPEAWAAAIETAQLAARDLTPGGSGAVWAHGPLGRYTRPIDRS